MKILHLTPDDNLQYILNSITEPTAIYLAEGIYRQKTEIRANDVTIIGSERETTVITYDDYARKIHADGQEYNTFRTYTLCVTGERVRLENLTVENSNTDPKTVGQCVALSVNAKNFSAKNVDLKSTQDTLFMYPFPDDLVVRYRGFIPQNQLYTEGRATHLFENCRICGTVDFIFGCSEAYFKDCEIISIYDDREIGFVCAPAHPLAEDAGFNFIDCNFISQGVKKATNYLARPWRDFGKSVFINCTVDEHITPELFDKWNDTERDKTA
ncbi:MAG: pectin esterase, partial [Clostridia bacterium]|nr:pectin esterase [Clostridia bacterium]